MKNLSALKTAKNNKKNDTTRIIFLIEIKDIVWGDFQKFANVANLLII